MPTAEVLIPARFSAATRAGPPRDGQVLRLDGQTMGTRWSVQVVARAADPLDALRTGIDAALADLVAQCSHWQPDSALCRYNRAPAGTRFRLPPHFARVLDAALDIADASDGALDPTLGPLVDLWGYGPPGPRTGSPEAAAIAAARARCGWRRLRRDAAGALVQPGGVQLDFSAIAKGHAVDVIADRLDRAGRPNHLVEIGGELRGQGVKPDGQPWWVGIEDSRPALRLALDGLSVATSGSAYRRHVQDGVVDAHTIDPRTGAPLAAAPDQVTVIHPSCRHADGWATALTVLGPVDGLRLADRLGLASRWVSGGRVVVSNAWRALRMP